MSGVGGERGPSGGSIVGKMMLGVCATVTGGTLQAETVRCDLDGLALSFELDRAQFVDAYAPGEPPRRKVTRVALDEERFEAEPFVLDGQIGFHAGARMFVAQEGRGRLIDTVTGAERNGPCEVD